MSTQSDEQARRKPARSLYLVTYSDVDGIDVGQHLVDRGVVLLRHWEFVNMGTEAFTSATGERVTRLCAACHDRFNRATAIDHAGDCATDTEAATQDPRFRPDKNTA